MTTMVQVRLESGQTQLTCWVEPAKPFRVGNAITLKDSGDVDRRWKVLAIGASRDRSAINRGWKVGGL
jgi:hypothetical protein